MRLKSIIIIILLCLFLSVSNLISKIKLGKSITLREAIILAEKNDTLLNKLNFDRKIFDVQLDQAIKNFFPTITSELKRTHAVTFSNPRGATIITFSNSAELPVYDRAIIYKKKKADSEILFNRYKIESRLNEIRKEMITLYYSVLNLEAIVKIRKEEFLQSKESFKLTQKKLKHKRIIPLDLLLTKGLMVENSNELMKARHDYEEEKMKLLAKLNLKGAIYLSKGLWNIKGKTSVKESMNIALRQRVEIKEKLIDRKIRLEQYNIEQSIFYPKITLFSDISLSGENRYALKDRTDWSIFITLSLAILDDVTITPSVGTNKDYRVANPTDEESLKLTLFDKSSNKVERETAKSNFKSIHNEIRDLKHKIQLEILEAFNDLKEAKGELKLAKLNIKIGHGLVRKSESEIRSGKKSLEDLIEARKNNIRYRIGYQQAILSYRLAVLNLKWATGTLWKDRFY